MHLPRFFIACMGVPLATAFLVAPPAGTPAAPETTVDCSAWVVPTSATTCASICTEFGFTLAFFEQLNPISAIGSSCTLIDSFAYCVQENFESFNATTSSQPPSTTTSSQHSTATTTSVVITSTTFATVTTTTGSTATITSGNGIVTPTPFQPGMISSCDAFHLVVSGDTCDAIAAEFGITFAQFLAWNPAVGSECTTLFLGDFVCVDVIGVTPSATTTTAAAATTTTTSNNGITTPTPTQAGMVTDCDAFHLVVSGDDCDTIAASAGISLDEFLEWNSGVGSTCADLFLGTFACIGIL